MASSEMHLQGGQCEYNFPRVLRAGLGGARRGGGGARACAPAARPPVRAARAAGAARSASVLALQRRELVDRCGRRKALVKNCIL